MDEVDARQASLIQNFSSKADLMESPEKLAELILDVTANNNLIYHSQILSLPSVSKLAGTEQSWSLDLLRLFAFGTYHDYTRNKTNYPAFTPRQMQSLRHVHMISLVQSQILIQSKKAMAQSEKEQQQPQLSFGLLQKELDIPDEKDLKIFLRQCKTSDFVKFQIYEKSKVIVPQSSALSLLPKMRGIVSTGESFDVFLRNAAIVCTDPTGLLSNGIVRQVRVPLCEQGSFCVKVEFKEKASCLFGMLIEHVTRAHSCSKSFGGKIYAGMFVVIGNELFLCLEASPTEPLTDNNSKLDYLAVETMFLDHTGIPLSLDDPEGEIMYPIYSVNLFLHLECDVHVLSKDHYASPMRKAMDGKYTTFLRCHASLQPTPAHQAVLVHVRKHHKYSMCFDKDKFHAALCSITPHVPWHTYKGLWLFEKIFAYAKNNGFDYVNTSVGCFTFIRDWGTHFPEYLTESQKGIFTAAVRSFIIAHYFKDFFAQSLYQILCCYNDKKRAFSSNFKEWLQSLLRVTKVETVLTMRESNLLSLRGLLLPSDIYSKDLMERFLLDMQRLDEKASNGPPDHYRLAKWRALNNLRDKNITVYYKVLIDKMEQYSSIVYIPTAKVVAQNSSCMFTRSGVMRVSKDVGEMTSIIKSWPVDQLDMIVVTDGLSGLDDIGVESDSVIVGKVDLYVAAAGMNPQRVLPVIIDVGTNSSRLLKDPLYHGLQECRLTGEEYLAVIKEFLSAVSARWPSIVVQFEDINFGTQLLKHHRNSHRVLNDAIQGTAAVTIAGLLGVVRAQGRPLSHFAMQKIVIAASCSGGPLLELVNVAIRAMQMVSGSTISFASATKQFWIVDNNGLVTENRSGIDFDVLCRARKKRELEIDGLDEGASFNDVVKMIRPNMIILFSAFADLSVQEVLQAVKGSFSSRPAIFDLSGQSTPEEVFSTLGEKAIYASGDQFPHLDLGNGKIGFSNHINKIYLSPGIVLGTLVSGARQVSDEMLSAASLCLSSLVDEKDVRRGMLYPPVSSLRDITQKVATAVLGQAVKDGIAEGHGAMDAADLGKLSEEESIIYVGKRMWSPPYPT